MGSRLRENVKQLFECFCEVAAPNGEKQAWILQRYPETFDDQEILKSVPKFAYPCQLENSVVQHFSFVLTSIDSKWTFGFCRHDPKTDTALVVLSALPWHETFYKFLNHIATLTASSNAGDLWKFLEVVYQTAIPVPGGSVSIPLPDPKIVFVCQRPKQFQLPSIPENRNLTEYFSAVDSHNMMTVFASMLYERRIIFTSKRLSRLSACVQACNALIYPMIWQHIYIPVLPLALIDYLLAPMPFLIGVPTPILERVRQSDLGDVVILDADDNTIQSPFQDLESLPQDVVTNLRRALRNSPTLLGDGVSRAFLRALVQLTAGYREALTLQTGHNDDHVRITFDQEAFVESRPISMQPFIRKMLELQIFQQFIEERLHMLNSGLGFSDEFEMEACNYSDKSVSKFVQQYKEWTYAMRKEGSAFFRSVKDKANPAVKYAVKSVKDKGKDMKTAYKGLKWKGRSSRSENSMRFPQPRSAPSSPTLDRRPISFSSPSNKSPSGFTPTTSYRRDHLLRVSNVDTSRKQYSPLDPSSPEEPESPPERLNIDLMHELRDVIFSNTPHVDRTLKPVRSLDSLRPAWSGRLRQGPLPNNSSTACPYEPFESSDTIIDSSTAYGLDSPNVPRSQPEIAKEAFSNQVPSRSNTPILNVAQNSISRPTNKLTTASSSSSSSSTSPPSPIKGVAFLSKQLPPMPQPLRNPNRSNEFTNLSNPLLQSASGKTETSTDTATAATTVLHGNKLRSQDPFEIYSTNSTAPNEANPYDDPFDTSRALHPFGIPNPIFQFTKHKPPVKSPSPSTLIYNESCSALAKDESGDVQDLIRLDSTNSDDDFDPLISKPSSRTTCSKQMTQSLHIPRLEEGLSNPLYPYFLPQCNDSTAAEANTTPSTSVDTNQALRKDKLGDQDLLQEYGLDFGKFSLVNGASTSSKKSSITKQGEAESSNCIDDTFGASFDRPVVKSQNNWTTFE